MGGFGLGLILSAVAGALGYLLAGHGQWWPGAHTADTKPTQPKGDGAAAQPSGPAAPAVVLPGTYSAGGGATQANKAAEPSTTPVAAQPIPVSPPTRTSVFVPPWANPESANTQVD